MVGGVQQHQQPGGAVSPSDAELRETHSALSILLADATSFSAVLDAFFTAIDQDHDGKLTACELEEFVGSTCAGMGLAPPHPHSVGVVFKQLDLNSDRSISRDELSVFLRHLFQEQVKYCALKLHMGPPATTTGSDK